MRMMVVMLCLKMCDVVYDDVCDVVMCMVCCDVVMCMCCDVYDVL